MSAQALKSAAPPHAIRIWCDGLSLFAEIPGAPGHAPFIVEESICEGGLWKMLNLLRIRVKETPYASSKMKDQVVIRKVGGVEQPMTKGQRDAAAEVLKKLGMI